MIDDSPAHRPPTADLAVSLPTHAPDMSRALADELVRAATTYAEARGLALAVAVVDRGGNLVAACRMDGAQLGAITLAQDKAFTATAFGRPTRAWVDSSAPGAADWGLAGTLGGRAIVFPGGVPVAIEGQTIGGLGVSGAASSTDDACAEHACAEVLSPEGMNGEIREGTAAVVGAAVAPDVPIPPQSHPRAR